MAEDNKMKELDAQVMGAYGVDAEMPTLRPAFEETDVFTSEHLVKGLENNTHYDFYANAMRNEMLPHNLSVDKKNITEEDVSGEFLAITRNLLHSKYKFMGDNEYGIITADDYNKYFNLSERNGFDTKHYNFIFKKENNKYRLKNGNDYLNNQNIPLDTYYNAMADDNSSIPIALTIPFQDTITMINDDDLSEEENFTFKGLMTNIRKAASDLFISKANAHANDNQIFLDDYETYYKLKFFGYEPFPMDGTDLEGRLNPQALKTLQEFEDNQ